MELRLAALAALSFGLLACKAPEASNSERLTAALSAKLGRSVELHYVETEPGGTKATCGYAGDAPARGAAGPIPTPLNDVRFIFENGRLMVSDGAGDFDALVRQHCPSMTIPLAPPAVS